MYFNCFLSVPVEDGENKIQEQPFAINVIPVNNSPPSPAEDNPKVLVTQAGTVAIGTGIISVHDPDTPLDELIFTLETNPLAGHFIKKDDTMKVMLRAGTVTSYCGLFRHLLKSYLSVD